MAKVRGVIVVDTERCKGCEVCIPVCPADVIAMSDMVNGKGYNYMEQVGAECTGCSNCAAVCPDGVITVYRAKV
jgi:2-oxoglutarate ferredoxin oxidoreductase subunit delta